MLFQIFFAILLSIKLLAADNPKNSNGFTTDFNKGNPVFNNEPTHLFNKDPRDPPDIIIFFISALLSFISDDISFSRELLNLVVCLIVKYSS